jgi:hypothetical protein
MRTEDTLSKLEFFSLALRKIALSLKSVFPIISSYLLTRSHSMFMLSPNAKLPRSAQAVQNGRCRARLVLHTLFSPILIFLPEK